MKPGKTPSVPAWFNVKLAARLAPIPRVQEAFRRVRAAGRHPRETVNLTDLRLSVIERKFVYAFAHLPVDVDLPSYIDSWIKNQQRFGQPRLDDYDHDLALMLGQPEVLQMLGDWLYPSVASTGPKPRHAFSKGVMLVMAAQGKSAHLDDSVDDVRTSQPKQNALAWALELGAHMRERPEPPFKIIEKADNVYRHIPKLAATLGRKGMETNVRMLRSVAALYPKLPVCVVAGIDGTAVPAWCQQRKGRTHDEEAGLRARTARAGFRCYVYANGGKRDLVSGERVALQKVKAWRGYHLVVLVDYCTGRPIVWTLIPADDDEAKALHELLRVLFELWPDCPLKTIVGDGAWDEEWAHELCERNYGIHLVASRTNERRLDAPHRIDDESCVVGRFNGRGEAFCRKHDHRLTWVGNEYPNREKLGLGPGDPAPASAFRLRFKCEAADDLGSPLPDRCGTTSLQMQEHWTALAYYAHTPSSKPKRYADRYALLDHRNVCESAFNALKVGRGLATVGADRLRLTDDHSVIALIDLAFCMGTALLLAQERDKLGVEYPSPPWYAGEQPLAA